MVIYIRTVSIVTCERRIAISQLHKIVHAVPRILCDAALILGLKKVNPITHMSLKAFREQQLPVFGRGLQRKTLLVRRARKVVGEEIHLFEQGLVVREGEAEIWDTCAHLVERIATTGC